MEFRPSLYREQAHPTRTASLCFSTLFLVYTSLRLCLPRQESAGLSLAFPGLEYMMNTIFIFIWNMDKIALSKVRFTTGVTLTATLQCNFATVPGSSVTAPTYPDDQNP